MIHDVSGKGEFYKGSEPSRSPTTQPSGVFGFCNGGIPEKGAFARLPGKTMRDTGIGKGSAITVYQFGQNVVVQRWIGIEIFKIAELAPNELDYVYDNFGNLVYDSFGIALTQ